MLFRSMPGMETKLHGAFDQTGDFTGFSANYSGAGFSHMRFAARSVSPADFDAWVKQARASGQALDGATYLQLERPSEKEPVRHYASVAPGLFDAVVNMCVEPGKMCMHEMMSVDAKGGLGKAGIHNVRELAYDKYAARGTETPAKARIPSRYVAAGCATPMAPKALSEPAAISQSPLKGVGLKRPGKPLDEPEVLSSAFETRTSARPIS